MQVEHGDDGTEEASRTFPLLSAENRMPLLGGP